MRGNKRSDTRPEVALRRALHRRGLRFRKDFAITTHRMSIRPDIVFTKSRVAVFVDGCFWHGCPVHGRVPGGQNASYWADKMQRNRERDERQNEALREAGWRVVRVWEHESDFDAVTAVMAVLAADRDATTPP